MLGVTPSEAAILAGPTLMQAYILKSFYDDRDVVAATLQIDSSGLNLVRSYDLTTRNEIFDANEIDGLAYDQPAAMPTAVLQLLPTATKAQALAALDAIRAAVSASGLLS